MDAGVEISENVIPIAQKDVLREQLIAERSARETSCLNELIELLKKHDCQIIPVIHIFAGEIKSEIKITAR